MAAVNDDPERPPRGVGSGGGRIRCGLFRRVVYRRLFGLGRAGDGRAGPPSGRSRSMEMRFFRISDKCAQEMYALHWHPGQENLADYQSKLHAGAHHTKVRPWYLHEPNSPQELPRALRPSALKGCVGTQDGGYLNKVPLPRAPRIQSTAALMTGNPEVTPFQRSERVHRSNIPPDRYLLLTGPTDSHVERSSTIASRCDQKQYASSRTALVNVVIN